MQLGRGSKDAYKVLVWKPIVKYPLEGIKMDFGEMGSEAG
jgi:hypothetical protein